jgi:hypothetical protein
MRKQKQSPLILTLEDLTNQYDRVALVRSLQQLKTEPAWQILRAALIKEYQDQVIYALDNCGKTGKQIEAARHAGIAETLLDTATTLIDKYIDILEKKSAVIEDVRPEE